MPDRHPTARRLIEHGLRLFAAAGVAGTPIVRIEEAAGLAPGSGAFYKHFRSKAELLEAAVEDAAAAMHVGVDLLALADGMTLEEQAVLIARGAWLLFDTNRDLVLVLTRETTSVPAGYGHGPTVFPGAGPAFLADWLRRHTHVADPEATALVLVDALTSYWLQREGESPTPYGVDEERFLAAWTELVARLR